MKALFASLMAVALLAALVVAPVATAQQAAPAGAAKTIEGKVMAVDPTGKSLTLDDGTKLTIPDSVKFTRADLKLGAAVKAAYEVRDGQNIVTNLEVAKP